MEERGLFAVRPLQVTARYDIALHLCHNWSLLKQLDAIILQL